MFWLCFSSHVFCLFHSSFSFSRPTCTLWFCGFTGRRCVLCLKPQEETTYEYVAVAVIGVALVRHGTLACVSALVMCNLYVSITALPPSPLTPHNPPSPSVVIGETHSKEQKRKRGKLMEKKNTQSWATTVKQGKRRHRTTPTHTQHSRYKQICESPHKDQLKLCCLYIYAFEMSTLPLSNSEILKT